VARVKAKYKVLETRGITIVVQVTLEDGRGFTLHTGVDRLEELEEMVREHARALFNVEVEKVEKAE
jgi:muramoyltetrapeptide carboxypeptidase LdcA involved in peptidoglycan recycling